MNVLDVYKPPFTTDGVYIYSADNVMSLMSANVSYYPEQMMERVCQLLNGEAKAKGTAEIATDNGEIYVNGTPYIIVRGWGHLTGVGGLNLPPEEAARIQDEFARWVVYKLRGEEPTI